MSRPFRSVAALVAVVLAAAMLPAAWSSADAAPRDGMYRSLHDFRPTGGKVRVHPDDYTAYRVDTREVRADLARAPKLGSSGATVFRVPTPNGGTERFAVQRTQVMEAGLAEAHPEISTWAGYSLDHRGTNVVLDVTPMGFHASVRGPNGQGAWFVDPAFNTRGTTQHLSYYGSDLDRPRDLVERQLPDVDRAVATSPSSPERSARAATGTVTQRVYRLALLSDPTYADYFGSRNVTAEKVTLMARVNQLYNDDVAITMILVDGTDKLNLDTEDKATGANGPCGAHPCYTNDPASDDYVEGQIAFCDVGTLVRNQTVLGQLIGASNYDIGHLALGTNGGGIAGLGVVGSIDKAQGCTGIPDTIGDYYAIDYVAHEMGHQFGGNHTFNGNQWNCSGGNRNAGTSVEPGSGSSIMAYAGICRADNLQAHSDPYFSQRSIQEIGRYTSHQAAPPVEVQDVSLTGFGSGDSFDLSYGDNPDTVTFTEGDNYDATSIEAAVEDLTGTDVTVARWGYDPYVGYVFSPPDFPAPTGQPDDTGFQVIFAGDADPYTDDSDRANMMSLHVTNLSGSATAHVGETAKGGPADNRGDRIISSRNHAPVVHAPANKTIPMRTPFTLSGHARDRDGDRITYLWEQNDRGGRAGTALVDNTRRNGPLFRVFGGVADVSDRDATHSPAPGENHAGTSGTRTFPDLAQILHRNTNAKTGKCPRVRPPRQQDIKLSRRTLDCYSEFLPVRGYRGSAGSAHPAMHFRLTARDAVLGGGGVGHDDVTLRLAPKAGPFLVTSFGGRHDSVKRGKKALVRWRVNGTRHLAHQVRIVLSTDNGKTWRKVLDRRTANDGHARVRFPKNRTRHAWIKIEAVHNYFFDTNDRPFRIR